MAFFRKRPVVVMAIQWTGENLTVARAFLGSSFVRWFEPNNIAIKTPEGIMNANKDDWLIRGMMGEHYPCKPDLFALTYEPVEADYDPQF